MNDLAARTLGLRVRAASTFGMARGTMRIKKVVASTTAER
jgi:hypothetical protein